MSENERGAKKVKRTDFYAALQSLDSAEEAALENMIIDQIATDSVKYGDDAMIKWLREKNGYPGATEASWEKMAKKNPLITRATFEALGYDLHIGDLVSIDALGREIGPEMRVMDRYDETETYWLVPAEDVPLDGD